MRTRRLTLVSLTAAALGCQHPEAGGFAPATLEIVSGNDQVRAAGTWKVRATCPFVVTFLKRHPEYNDLVVP